MIEKKHAPQSKGRSGHIAKHVHREGERPKTAMEEAQAARNQAREARRKKAEFDRLYGYEYLASRLDVTQLMLHAVNGHLKYMKPLVAENIHELAKKNRDGNTALALAVANGHSPCVVFLLEAKAEILVKNALGITPIDIAVEQSGLGGESTRLLLAKVDYLAMHIFDGPYQMKSEKALALLHKQEVIVLKNIFLGETPDFTDIFGADDEYRITWLRRLHTVLRHIKYGILLLDDSIGYLERDAAMGGALEIDAGKRFVYLPESRNIVKFGDALRTVYASKMNLRMIEAATEGDAVAIQGLLKAKSHPNVKDRVGRTLLMHTCVRGDMKVLQTLLEAHADHTTINPNGYSALLIAATGRHAGAVKLLLAAKADARAKTFSGNSVIDFVKHEGHRDILQILLHPNDKEVQMISEVDGMPPVERDRLAREAEVAALKPRVRPT